MCEGGPWPGPTRSHQSEGSRKAGERLSFHTFRRKVTQARGDQPVFLLSRGSPKWNELAFLHETHWGAPVAGPEGVSKVAAARAPPGLLGKGLLGGAHSSAPACLPGPQPLA